MRREKITVKEAYYTYNYFFKKEKYLIDNWKLLKFNVIFLDVNDIIKRMLCLTL